jgi:hypothetical protein
MPSDIGVLVLHEAAGELTDTTLVVRRLRGGVSGGTLASLKGTVDDVKRDRSLARVLADPYTLSPDRDAELELAFPEHGTRTATFARRSPDPNSPHGVRRRFAPRRPNPPAGMRRQGSAPSPVLVLWKGSSLRQADQTVALDEEQASPSCGREFCISREAAVIPSSVRAAGQRHIRTRRRSRGSPVNT